MLLESASDAFTKLTKSADPSDVQKWTTGAADAQARRHEDVKAMDYFALKVNQGKFLSY